MIKKFIWTFLQSLDISGIFYTKIYLLPLTCHTFQLPLRLLEPKLWVTLEDSAREKRRQRHKDPKLGLPGSVWTPDGASALPPGRGAVGRSSGRGVFVARLRFARRASFNPYSVW